MGVGLSELDSLRSQCIQVGCDQIGRAEAVYVERALVVGIENDYIRLSTVLSRCRNGEGSKQRDSSTNTHQ